MAGSVIQRPKVSVSERKPASRTLIVCGTGRKIVRQLVRHLNRDPRIDVSMDADEAAPVDPSLLYTGEGLDGLHAHVERLERDHPDAKIVFLVRNPIDFVATYRNPKAEKGAARRGEAINDWNADIVAACVLGPTGRIFVASYEQLFIWLQQWDRLSRFLRIEISAPAEAIEEDIPELRSTAKERILTTCRIENYRFLLKGSSAIQMFQGEDANVIEYPWEDVGARIAVRRTLGKPIPDRPDVTTVGSAATFGRFVEEPFADIIARKTTLSVANLGYGGARPEAYLTDDALMYLIERSGLLVLELMSGRGYENDMFRAIGPAYNVVEVKPAYKSLLPGLDHTKPIFVDWVWERAFKHLPAADVAGLIAQSSAKLERDLMALAAVAPRTIVFHLAQAPLPEATTAKTYRFPHMVTRSMADRVSSGHGWCSVVSTVGIPSKLVDRETGEPTPVLVGWPDPTENHYFPSPEMHREAADALIPLLTV